MGRRPRGPGSPRGPGPPRSGPGLPPLLLVLALAAHGGCAAPAPRAEDLSLGVVSVRRGHGSLGTREPSSRALRRSKGEGRLSLVLLGEVRESRAGRGEPISKAEKLRLGLGLREAHACRSRKMPGPFPAPCSRTPQTRAPRGGGRPVGVGSLVKSSSTETSGGVTSVTDARSGAPRELRGRSGRSGARTPGRGRACGRPENLGFPSLPRRRC